MARISKKKRNNKRLHKRTAATHSSACRCRCSTEQAISGLPPVRASNSICVGGGHITRRSAGPVLLQTCHCFSSSSSSRWLVKSVAGCCSGCALLACLLVWMSAATQLPRICAMLTSDACARASSRAFAWRGGVLAKGAVCQAVGCNTTRLRAARPCDAHWRTRPPAAVELLY